MDKAMIDWADTLINYSIARQLDGKLKGKAIYVRGETCAEPHMEALSYQIVKAGANPIIQPVFQFQTTTAGISEAQLSHGNKDQLAFIPPGTEEFYKGVDAFIFIKGSDNPAALDAYDRQLSITAKSWHRLSEYRSNKPCVLTLYPTEAEARREGFDDPEEFKSFVTNACRRDVYEQMSKDQDVLKNLMEKSNTVTLHTYHPDLRRILTLDMRIGDEESHSLIIKGDGLRNLPCGEAYTSPIANTVEGEIYFDIPIFYNGKEISGVYLKLERGRIVDYRANVGYDSLQSIIETDEGSNMIGEVAFATNPLIQHILRNILFIEKLGGTIHLAIGYSLQHCNQELEDNPGSREIILERLVKQGKLVRSAQHVDFPKDFRNPRDGEKIIIGDTEVMWADGHWITK